MWNEILSLWNKDNLQEQAWKRSFEMLKITHDMFLEAVRVLREDDSTGVREEVRAKDKIVNAYVWDVRKMVLTHLASQSPHELPEGMVLISIVIDIERLGDYTKNIVDLAVHHPRLLDAKKFEKELHAIEQAVKRLYAKTLKGFAEPNVEASRKLLDKYSWINTQSDKLLMELVDEKDPDIPSGIAVSLGLYIRWLKRINSHLQNIISSQVNPFPKIGFRTTK